MSAPLTVANRIAELNDRFRRSRSNDPVGLSLGKKVMTSGVRDLGLVAMVEIAERVVGFDAFSEDNDPHGEHDFGAFDHEGERIFWKIDYYDRASFGTGRDFGSEDPADAAKTLRVLTIMLAYEYSRPRRTIRRGYVVARSFGGSGSVSAPRARVSPPATTGAAASTRPKRARSVLRVSRRSSIASRTRAGSPAGFSASSSRKARPACGFRRSRPCIPI